MVALVAMYVIRNHDALYPKSFGHTFVRRTSLFATNDDGSISGAGSTEPAVNAERQSAVVLAGLSKGRWSEALKLAGLPEHELSAIECATNLHWQT